MSRISLGNNIPSLQAQRQLAKSSEMLSSTAERLASGLRINRASDDAAGLAIATSLNASARVFTQGIKNINDGISLLSIAEGATQELTGIVTRIKELAEQSSNGTYGNTQRIALDSEAQALRDEFNRIIETTEFNDIKLLDGSNTSLQIQAGGNAVLGRELTIGTDAIATAGDGTFQNRMVLTTGLDPRAFTSGDFNGDGKIDLVSTSAADSRIHVHFGNGDGTFLASISFATGTTPTNIESADLNGDGILDLVTSDYGDGRASVFLGLGDGTFGPRASYLASNNPQSHTLADVNNDGKIDILVTGQFGMRISVLLNNGDGTFQTQISATTGNQPRGLITGDFNEDGKIDIASIAGADGTIELFIGNGNGTFKAAVSMGDNIGSAIIAGDINHDSHLDLIATAAGQGVVKVLLGTGQGTFSNYVSYSAGTGPRAVKLGDVNGDGHLDIIAASNDISVHILTGVGDGTFRASTSYVGGPVFENSLEIADLNNDGATDIVIAHQNVASTSGYVLLGNTDAKLAGFSLRTRSEALSTLDQMDKVLQTVALNIGKIGAQRSRLQIASSNLQQARENYRSAESRITNADVAEESANFVRSNILQQIGASVLAQANQLPALVLSLLK